MTTQLQGGILAALTNATTTPKKEIEAALMYAEAHGWRVEPKRGNGHAWGKMLCPYNDVDCRCGEFCITSVWSTPRCPANHAKALQRVVDHCSVAQWIGGRSKSSRQAKN